MTTGTSTVNLHPGKYRGVSVTRVECDLDEESLHRFFVGRPAYFATRFAVVEHGDDVCIVRIHTADAQGTSASADQDLFRPIVGVTILAGPRETVLVHAPDVDTGIPSQLAEAARRLAPGHRAVVIHGRYEHISFIIDAQPIRLLVRDVVPPYPAKLVDQVARVLAVREDLPPIEIIPDLIDLADLAAAHPSHHYALPCRGSGFVSSSAEVSYLDEHPVRRDWLLLGCTRSQQIHRQFYGDDADAVTLCPLQRPMGAELVLAKCCLQDDELRSGPNWVSVPWGASLQRVSEALDVVATLGEAAWQPV